MPGVRTRLLPAMAGVLAAAGLALPGTLGAATAAPRVPLSGPVKWLGEHGPIPKAVAHTAPALATIAVSETQSRRLIFWTGPSLSAKDFQISYQTSINLRKNLWTAPNLVDSGKATTNSRPAATPDFGPIGGPPIPGQIMVVWKEAKGSSILYSIGQAGKGTTLTWGSAKTVPGAMTSNGPAAITTFTGYILIVWKDASTSAIDFIVGTPLSHGLVHWGKVGTIPGAATTTTPAIAEVFNKKGPVGVIYVLWKTTGAVGRIDFAGAIDQLDFPLRWSSPRTLPATVKTPTAPSAEPVGTDETLPLLIVFQKPGSSTLEYVTMGATGAIGGGPFKVPQLTSTNGTSIDQGVIAAEAPAPASAARILDPDNIFYLPFVRPCAGCRPK